MDDRHEQMVFDRLRLMDNINGDTDLLKNICKVFVDTKQAYLDDIRVAVSNKDAASLAAAAHKFKGTVANFYAERAREASLVLENMGKEARFEEADAAFLDLEKEVGLLTAALEKELQRDDSTGISQQDLKETPASGHETHISGKIEEKAVCNLQRMLKDLNSDRRLFREIGGEFLKICDQPVSVIRNAAHSKNSAALTDAANAFKGMVSGYYAERLVAVAEALALKGKQENFNGIRAALEILDKEVKLFCEELRAAISYETTEAEDAISRKKADVLDLVEELRISVETTYTLKNAIQHRMDALETRLAQREGEIAKILEEFETLKEAMRNTEPLDETPSSPMQQIVSEMKDKISAIEKEFIGEKEGLKLTRKDMAGIIGMLKDFRKILNALIVRFGTHIAQHHQKKVPPGEKHDSQWLLKNYKFKGL